MSELSIRIDASKLATFLARVPDMADRLMQKFKREAGDLVQGGMVRRAPFDKGFLSMMILQEETPLGVFIKSTASYTKWVVGGTGLYGPRGRRIFPVHAKALRFKIGGRTIFARSVAGMRPNPFIKDTKEALTPEVADLVKQIIREVYQ